MYVVIALGIMLLWYGFAVGVFCYNKGRDDGLSFCLKVLHKNGAHGQANKIRKEEKKRAKIDSYK